MRNRVAPWVVAIGLGFVMVGSAGPAAASLNKSITSGSLKALANSVNKGKHLTYEATYKSVSAGQTTVVTIAQAPPKSDFSTSGGAVIDTGKSTYYCSSSGGMQTCLSASGSNPFVGLEAIFSPAAALSAFTEAKESLGSHLLGIKVTSTSAMFAGQPSTCVTVAVKGNGGKYCVTKQGLLSYSGSSSSGYFELTKFSTKPAATLFALPAGATTVTLPGGVSIP
jgi:hypothetical protein